MKEALIRAKDGLHARPIAEFVRLAETHAGEVIVSKQEQSVNGKSVLRLLTLGVVQGDVVRVEVTGNPELEQRLADYLHSVD